MSVELGVVCPVVPDAEQVARLVGPLMSMVLRRPVIHALIDHDHTAAAIAILGEGRIIDEVNLVNGGDLSGRSCPPVTC